jgi:L-ascorbate metabolism protein UlaG (beta-lactamase superfamily)
MIEEILKNMKWLGHSGFLIQAAGKALYIDPYKIPQGLPQADIILISHEHYDHCSIEDINKLKKNETIYITEKKAAKEVRGRVTVLQPGEQTEIDGISVTAVPAYNTNKKFHPRQNGWLGFVVTVEGVRIYHAGDTDHIPEMKDIDTDIALLPVSGTYVMTALEAAQAALDINPVVAVPMHCGSLVGTMDDAKTFADALKGKIRVEILS